MTKEVNSITADGATNVYSTQSGEVNNDNSDEESSISTLRNSSFIRKKKVPWGQVFKMGFLSLGAIYGDIGTSPLYTLSSITYKSSPPKSEEIYGGISIIFYLLTIIVIAKYVSIVLFIGPNEGEGGQIAIYAKIARCLKVGPKGVNIPGSNQGTEFELISRSMTSSSYKTTKSVLKKDYGFKNNPMVIKIVSKVIMICCFLGCSLVFSDGLLTPTTSVLSAIAGIQISKPSFNNVLAVSEVVLVFLFILQQLGSQKISSVFAPIILLWLIGLAICGIYNIVVYQPAIFKSLSPFYAIQLLKSGGIDNFGGAMLAITGTEAMFADIGHFGRLPIQLTLTFLVYPVLVLSYLGQGAYLVHHPESISNPFFYSIPGGTNSWSYWIMFVLATLSTIIASQALILGVFSILSQLISLDCFPNFKIVHVSKNYVGKVYIPAINWILMIGVCCTTAGFRTSANVTAAYGLGISLDFLVTSILILICMIYVYNWNILIPIAYTLIFVPLEIVLVIANFKKFTHGAWFPILIAGLCFLFLYFWRWARSNKVRQEFNSRVRIDDLYPMYKKQEIPVAVTINLDTRDIVNRNDAIDANAAKKGYVAQGDNTMLVNSKYGISNVKIYDGIAVIHTNTYIHTLQSPNTVPLIFSKLIRSYSSIPSVVIFCGIKVLSIPEVPEEEKIVIGSMKVPSHYRCILRFGFMEEIKIDETLNYKILSSFPEVESLYRKHNIKNFKSCLNGKSPFPVLHIFEDDLIRSHEYSSKEYKEKNIIIKIQLGLRKLMINNVFSVICSIFEAKGQFLKIENEEDESERKVYFGGIVRI